MTPSNFPVTSREYKLMLNTERFRERKQGVQVFLRLIEFLIHKDGGIPIPNKKEDIEYRFTSYLDTPEHALSRHGYSLRLREERKDKFKLTLKYRAADRYIAAARDLSCSQKEAKPKFEEDILPPFVSKFSHSVSAEFSQMPDLSSMNDVVVLFPGLKNLPIDEKVVIETTNNFKVFEMVHKLCQFKFGESPSIKACLSFWYLIGKMKIEEIKPNEIDDWPLVGEFSFDYDLPDKEKNESTLECYPSHLVEGTNRFFGALQRQVGWINFNTTTKTAFALEVL